MFLLEDEESAASADPQWSDSELEWPEPKPELTELMPEPGESRTPPSKATAVSPGPTAIRMLPGATPVPGDPHPSGFSPRPSASVAEDDWTRSAPAPPIIGPAMVAPRNMTDVPERSATRPQAATMEARQPYIVEPQPMLAPPSAPESFRSEPRIARPSVDVSESHPIAVRSDTGYTAVDPAMDPAIDAKIDPSDEATSPQIAPQTSSIESDEGDYNIVKVFYGTDRNAVDVLGSDARGYLGWFYLTALSAAITVVLIVIAYRFSQRLPVLLLTGTGVVATVMLGVVTTMARLQQEAPGPRPNRNYGNQRGELEMGICEVSIPKRHETGEIERPSVFRFEFTEDPSRHVVLLDVEEQPAEAFFASLRDRVDASQKREAFVFVHGFNFTFEEAAHRTAQLAFDLEFDGAPIFFSWPSQGGLLQYSIDETNVVWAVPHLKQFVTSVARESGAEAVHLIAHSMGNRALTLALKSLSYEMQNEPPLFREVVLTAPDIDADVFSRDIAPAIVGTADRVTLYASSNDEALRLSKTIHGYRRAGDSGSELLVIPGVETIDVSTVDTSLLGHDYYGDNMSVIADMLDLINESKPAELRRWLQAAGPAHRLYWIFQGPAAVTAAPASGPSVQR
ncbi:MAG: alpha/beta hydrolase [Planctomycetes bacterium]|nr:alpha/beta hydrolase [Planctomycetota bacterium]